MQRGRGRGGEEEKHTRGAWMLESGSGISNWHVKEGQHFSSSLALQLIRYERNYKIIPNKNYIFVDIQYVCMFIEQTYINLIFSMLKCIFNVSILLLNNKYNNNNNSHMSDWYFSVQRSHIRCHSMMAEN